MSQLYVTWPRVTGTYWECTYTITMPLSTPCSSFSPIITSVPHDKSAVLHSYNETRSAQPIMAYASRSLNTPACLGIGRFAQQFVIRAPPAIVDAAF